MGLINFIEKIQKKPRYVRIQILWISVFISMLIIVSLWVISFKYSFEAPQTAQEDSEGLKQIKEKLPSLGQVFKASIDSFFRETEKLENLDQASSNEKELEEIQANLLPLSY